MKVMIDAPHVECMIDAFPDLATLREQLRFGSRVEVPVSRLSTDALRFLGKLYRDAGPAMQARAAIGISDAA